MWIKRSDYEDLTSDLEKYRRKAEDLERAIYYANEGNSVYMSGINVPGVFLSTDHFQIYNDEISELKDKVEHLKKDILDLEASRDYYKRKYGELMNE